MIMMIAITKMVCHDLQLCIMLLACDLVVVVVGVFSVQILNKYVLYKFQQLFLDNDARCLAFDCDLFCFDVIYLWMLQAGSHILVGQHSGQDSYVFFEYCFQQVIDKQHSKWQISFNVSCNMTSSSAMMADTLLNRTSIQCLAIIIEFY